MTAFAPHLPPPSCSVDTHTRLTRLKLFVFTVVVALLTSLVGALLLVNAWYPTGLSNSTILISNRANQNPTLDSAVIRDWRSRVIELFDESKIQQNKYYTENARLTRAVVVNSGGWSVAPLIILPAKINLLGIDYQGHRLSVEKIVMDEVHKLMFIKFVGADFRANSIFAPHSALQPGHILWSLGNEWQPVTVGQKIFSPSPLAATIDSIILPLVDIGAANRLLITDRGELVGFTADNQTIIPVWMIGYILPRLLSQDTAVNLPFEWRGSFLETIKIDDQNQEATGFLVSDVFPKNAKIESVVKRGDVIMKIQDQVVTRENITQLIMSAPDTFSITVLRGEKTLVLNIKK